MYHQIINETGIITDGSGDVIIVKVDARGVRYVVPLTRLEATRLVGILEEERFKYDGSGLPGS